MQNDLTTRMLLTGILLCLGLLVVRGTVAATSGAAPGRYRVLSMRSGMKSILVRMDTVTGNLWRADDVLDPGAHWFVYPDPLAEAEVEEAVSEEPAPTEGSGARVEGVPGPDSAASKGPAELSFFTEALSPSSPPEMRIWAAEQLGGSPVDSAGAVPLLIGLLPQADPKLLVTALGALGRRADASAMPAVRKFLDHPDSQVRSAAAAAVSQIAGEVPSESAQGAR